MSDETAVDWQQLKGESELLCSMLHLPTQILIKWICTLPEYLGTSSGLIGLGKNRFDRIRRMPNTLKKGNYKQFYIYHMSVIAVFLFLRNVVHWCKTSQQCCWWNRWKELRFGLRWPFCELWGIVSLEMIHTTQEINVNTFFPFFSNVNLCLRQGIIKAHFCLKVKRKRDKKKK